MNDTDANRRRNLGFFFEETVRRLPDKVAIIDLFGEVGSGFLLPALLST